MSTALVLDIDGVVCPATGAGVPSPRICAALAGLGDSAGVTPVWLTSRLPFMRLDLTPPLPGRDWEQIDVYGGAEAWPKWLALRGWLRRNPQINRVAWVDDDLAHAGRTEACTPALGLPALLIAPVAEEGLSVRDLGRLAQWLGRPPPLPPPLTM